MRFVSQMIKSLDGLGQGSEVIVQGAPKGRQNEMYKVKNRVFVVQPSRGVKNDRKEASNVFLFDDF